jgi:hypothetical protein
MLRRGPWAALEVRGSENRRRAVGDGLGYFRRRRNGSPRSLGGRLVLRGRNRFRRPWTGKMQTAPVQIAVGLVDADDEPPSPTGDEPPLPGLVRRISSARSSRALLARPALRSPALPLPSRNALHQARPRRLFGGPPGGFFIDPVRLEAGRIAATKKAVNAVQLPAPETSCRCHGKLRVAERPGCRPPGAQCRSCPMGKTGPSPSIWGRMACAAEAGRS